VLTFPGARGWPVRQAGGWVGGGSDLWPVEGTLGLSPYRRRPRRRHHGHGLEGQVGHRRHRGGGRASSREGAGEGGRGGQRHRRRTFLSFSGAAAAIPRNGCL
jgi:hypothetical protein